MTESDPTPPDIDVRELGRTAARTAVLALAAGILRERGELPLRLLARKAGGSTTLLYTLFGGKDGLAEALFMEGVHVFSERLHGVADGQDDPVECAVLLCHTYRELALRYPAHYNVMFRNAIPGYAPSPEALKSTLQLFGPLVAAVTRAQQSGRLRHENPEPLVTELWLATHGVVSAEHARFMPPGTDAAATLDRLVRHLLSAYTPRS